MFESTLLGKSLCLACPRLMKAIHCCGNERLPESLSVAGGEMRFPTELF